MGRALGRSPAACVEALVLRLSLKNPSLEGRPAVGLRQGQDMLEGPQRHPWSRCFGRPVPVVHLLGQFCPALSTEVPGASSFPAVAAARPPLLCSARPGCHPGVLPQHCSGQSQGFGSRASLAEGEFLPAPLCGFVCLVLFKTHAFKPLK